LTESADAKLQMIAVQDLSRASTWRKFAGTLARAGFPALQFERFFLPSVAWEMHYAISGFLQSDLSRLR
jgi:hypothetical protein